MSFLTMSGWGLLIGFVICYVLALGICKGGKKSRV